MVNVKKMLLKYLLTSSLCIFAQLIAFGQFCKDCDGKCPEAAVERGVRDRYFAQYDRTFVNKPKYTRSLLFNSSYFLFLKKFFEEQIDYLGVWFMFGVKEENIGDGVRVHDDQYFVHFVAGKSDKRLYHDAFELFNNSQTQVKPSGNVELTDSKRPTQSSPGTPIPISHPTNLLPGDILYADKSVVENHTKLFDNKFKRSNLMHTRAVFFCKSTFIAIGDILANNTNLKVRLSFGQYESRKACTCQNHSQQINLIATIVDEQGRDTELLVDYLKKKNASNKTKAKKNKDGDYNHGELCPNSCPEGYGNPTPLKKK